MSWKLEKKACLKLDSETVYTKGINSFIEEIVKRAAAADASECTSNERAASCRARTCTSTELINALRRRMAYDVLSTLRSIEQDLSDESLFRLYASSLLFSSDCAYVARLLIAAESVEDILDPDIDGNFLRPLVDVTMIDFAHAYAVTDAERQGPDRGRDNNYLYGIKSLITYFKRYEAEAEADGAFNRNKD